MDILITILVTILICIIGILFFIKWKASSNEEKKDSSDHSNNQQENDKRKDMKGKEEKENSDEQRLELIRSTLASLGCQLEWIEENQSYYTIYQGETLMVAFYEGIYYANFFDLWWHEVDLNDIDEMARVRRAVNECNLGGLDATVCFSVNETNQKMGIHTKVAVLLIDGIPHYDQYLRARLSCIFLQKQHFFEELSKLRNNEE